MASKELLEKIAPPFGDLYIRKETFEEYKNRVSPLLPHFPDNVLEQWLYRHFEFIDYHYLNLDLDKMRFTMEEWETDRIYNDIKTHEGDSLDGMSHHLYKSKNWLSEYMLSKRTWPNPIIILKNIFLDKWGSPYHLMEGHQRLAYFRELYRKEKATLLKEHSIWVVTIQ